MKETFALLSALVVLLSYPVYGWRIYRREIETNIASWSMFVLISVTFLLTYSASGAEENLIVTYGPVLGTTCILLVSLFRTKNLSLTKTDWVCVGITISSLVAWYFTKESKELAQYALYLALLADGVAIIPTIVFLRKNPKKDRPLMWMIFSFGYFLAIFSIKDHTFANYSLPVFMVVLPAFVWWPLLKYRIANKIPLKRWI